MMQRSYGCVDIWEAGEAFCITDSSGLFTHLHSAVNWLPCCFWLSLLELGAVLQGYLGPPPSCLQYSLCLVYNSTTVPGIIGQVGLFSYSWLTTSSHKARSVQEGNNPLLLPPLLPFCFSHFCVWLQDIYCNPLSFLLFKTQQLIILLF